MCVMEFYSTVKKDVLGVLQESGWNYKVLSEVIKAQKDRYTYVHSNMQILASNRKIMHIWGVESMGRELKMAA